MSQWKLLFYDGIFALKEYIWAGGLIFVLSFFYDADFITKITVLSIVFVITFIPFYALIVLIRILSKRRNFPIDLNDYIKYYDENIWWF